MVEDKPLFDKHYEEDFNRVFSRNLRYFLAVNNMTQLELAKNLGVGTTSVYNWCNGIKTPRINKVDAMCSLFGCRRSDLMEDRTLNETNSSANFSKEEEKIIAAYREADDIDKAIVLRTLHLDEDSGEKNKLA